jgi:hypothetical protein
LPELIFSLFDFKIRFPLLITILTVSSTPLIHFQKRNMYIIFLWLLPSSVWLFFVYVPCAKQFSLPAIFILSFIFPPSYFLYKDVFTSKESHYIVIGSFRYTII